VHELIPDWNAVVAAEYRSVVGEADPAAGINRRFAFERAATRIRARLDNGELDIPLDDVIDRHIHSSLQTADRTDARAADRVLERLAGGEASLSMDDDPFLDTVVTLGDGLRKQWRHIKSIDLVSMHDIRAENMQRQEKAFKAFTENIRMLSRAIDGFDTVGQAWDAGALTQAASAAS
jgi:hypothetical protein